MERFNGHFITALSRLAGERPASWPDFIPTVLGIVRGTPDDTTGVSPVRLMLTTTGNVMPRITPANVDLANHSPGSAMPLDDDGLEGHLDDPARAE